MKDKEDFKGTFKWKFFIPIMFLLSWACMVTGPIFFSFGYQIYCFVVIGYSIIKTIGLGISSAYAVYKLKKIIKKSEAESERNQTSPSEEILRSIYHAIIIPSYKEDQELLQQTLNKLALHPKSTQTFLIFLAMEAHQQGCQEKANRLIESNKNNFRHVAFTRHVVREGEAKGKASNVSWCAEHLLENLEGMMINKQQILLTIMDADSWAPKEYFDQVEAYLNKNPQKFNISMFCPPQIFTRNHLDVPVFNRIYDMMHSLVHLSSLVAFYFSFPLSNYSISYIMIEKVGFWDTNPDAIGEDFHTCQKCFWKINGTVNTVAIYTPFNQLSLITGKGYCSDIKARFWQLERHTRGVSDVAYSCNMLTKATFQFRNIFLTLLVVEVFIVAAVVPWAILSLGIQYKLIADQKLHHFPMWIIDVILNLTPAFTIFSYIFYEWFRRVGNRDLFNQKNDPIWRCIEYPILFVIALFGYSIPAFVLSSFGVICTKTEYRVAQKKVEKENKEDKMKQIKNPEVNGDNKINPDDRIEQENTDRVLTKLEIIDTSPEIASINKQKQEVQIQKQPSNRTQDPDLNKRDTVSL